MSLILFKNKNLPLTSPKGSTPVRTHCNRTQDGFTVNSPSASRICESNTLIYSTCLLTIHTPLPYR
jgi:hypothetical protein